MDNGAKTPVTKLQEYLVRNGMTPRYELIESGIGIHNGTFKYLVTARGIRAVGAGRSKKEAKHEAARMVLTNIILESEQSTSHDKDQDSIVQRRLCTPSPDPDDFSKHVEDLSICRDTSASLPGDAPVGNCVGKLQDLCMANEIPLATYKLTGDVGPPHRKQFTFQCQIQMLTIEGVSRTKKQAKQLAAHNMINKLRKSCRDLLCTTSEIRSGPNTLVDLEKPCESYKEVINRYKEMGSKLRTTKRLPLGLKVSQYHNSLVHLNCKALQELKEKTEIYSNWVVTLSDPQSVLEEIMNQLECDISYEFTEGVKYDTVVYVSLGTSPESVLVGMGNSKETAIRMGCINALNHLLLMTR